MMALQTKDSDGLDEVRGERVMRRNRLTFAIILGAVLVSVFYPQAIFGLVLFAAVILALLYWPPRSAAKAREASAAADEAGNWPDNGMKAVVEALGEPALIIDRTMYLRYRNPACSVAFGMMTLGDPISMRIRSPGLLQALEAAVGANRPATTTLDDRRAVDRIWRVEILPIPPRAGEEPRFYLVVFHDRTAERRTEQIRTDFVANASHELRTPLASLMGFIETLQGPARDDAVARDQFLGIMRQQAVRMSRLIDDLLSLSRIEMKRHVPVGETVDLEAVFETIANLMHPVAEELGLSIERDTPPGRYLVAGEEDELIQVFSNLVENACKYAEAGKRVTLRLGTGSERGRAIVDASVIDYGPGIPEEHVPRLTERFYRVDVGDSRSKRGTGLGLSIVRNILLRHKARLVITSKVGFGSTFTARFPAVDEIRASRDKEEQNQMLKAS